jgi:membrane-associated phospholipid phosphatase
MFRAFFYGLPANVSACFRGYNLLWQLFAGVATYILVMSGFDWFYFESTRSSVLFWWTLPAAFAGFFLPIVMPLFIYLVGEYKKDKRLILSGAAVGQAAILAYAISSVYKAFTGRMQPEFYTHFNTVDNSRDFHFGFWQHGIFWGWPSSHAAVAFATAIFLYRPARKSAEICSAPLCALHCSRRLH